MADETRRATKRLSVALWVVQGLLAVAFLMAGGSKLVATDDFVASAPWAQDVPRPLLLFIGAMEVLGALGLVVPRVTKVLPILTPLAALGLATIMLLAIGFHLSRAEWNVAFNVALLGLAAFVAYGRLRLAP